jgi:hypothetical protein
MLGTKENKRGKIVFLNVKDGKILRRDGLVIEEFDFVEGTLEKIYTKEREFNGERVLYWYVPLRDDNGDLYLLGLPYSSGVFKSIVLSLANDNDLTALSTIRIETYLKDGRTKVSVSDQGRKLNWITSELPPVKETQVGGRIIKDDSERMSFIAGLVKKINKE